MDVFREDREKQDGVRHYLLLGEHRGNEQLRRLRSKAHPSHHLDRDPEFLIELPDGVQILTVRVSTGRQ